VREGDAGGIRIAGLRKAFGPEQAAVDDVSLEIAPGTFFTLVGPSGCGKSTTLRCVAGLERPDAGEIEIAGVSVFSTRRRVNLPPHRRRIGMVFQSYAIWPHMTVYQNVAYPLKNLGKSRAEIDAGVRWALQLVGLEPKAQRPAPFLSGGEQQRVALARALVERPSVLLLDEPLSNLDAKLREEMRFELRELQQRLGLTAVYVTHDQEEAFALSDLIAVMHRGRVLELGDPEQVYQTPQTAFGAEFLGAATKLAGRVTGVESPAVVRVGTALGELACRCRVALPAGSPVWVYVRPEDVRVLGGEPPAGGDGLEARVRRVAVLGGIVEWWAEAGGVTVRARSLVNSPEGRGVRQSVDKTVRVSIALATCLPRTPEAGGPGAGAP
jgi:iron(III) transport system ATP-binding protein